MYLVPFSQYSCLGQHCCSVGSEEEHERSMIAHINTDICVWAGKRDKQYHSRPVWLEAGGQRGQEHIARWVGVHARQVDGLAPGRGQGFLHVSRPSSCAKCSRKEGFETVRRGTGELCTIEICITKSWGFWVQTS